MNPTFDLRPFLAAAPRRANSPILSCLYLGADCHGRIVAVTATDTETTIHARRPGDVELAGCYDARNVKGLDIETARLERNGTTIVLRSGAAAMPDTCSASDYPTLPTLPGDLDGTQVDPGELRKAADRVEDVAPSDDQRYGLNGTHLEPGEGGLQVTATDGSRLHWYVIPGAFRGAELPKHQVVPPPFFELAGKALPDRVRLTLGGEQPWIAAHGMREGWRITVHSRTRDGEFPAYRSVVPADTSEARGSVLSVDRATLLGAVRMALPYAQDTSRTVVLQRDPSGDYVYINARAVDVGEIHLRIPCRWTEGSVRVAGLNGVFLRDALETHETETIRLSFGDDGKERHGETLAPIPVLGDDGTYTLIMPIRLDSNYPNEPRTDATDYAPPARKAAAPRKAVARKATPATVTEPAPAPAPATAGPGDSGELAGLRKALAEREREASELRRALETAHRDIEARDGQITRLHREAREREARIVVSRNTAPVTEQPGPVVVRPVEQPSPVTEQSPAAVVPSTSGPARTGEEASESYRLAREALRSREPSAMRAALARLPEWSSRKGDVLRSELTAALTAAA